MTRFASLRAVRQLAACSDRQIEWLLRFADEVELAAGELVAEGGRPCTAFVVVLEGALRCGGRPLGPGDALGWDAMWDRSANCATVSVESNARLLVMSHDQFRAVKGLGLPEPTNAAA